MIKETIKKYKLDLIIIGSLLIVSLIVFLCLFLTSRKNNLIAEIKKENEIILKIDLSKEKETRTISLKNDYQIDMDLEVKENAIRVSRSGCPTQYCVNQGFITNSNQSIICAHYKVVINLGQTSEEIVI